MAMTQQQIQLVTAAQGGDMKSFEALYGIYHGKIYALARMILRNESDAEDVLQEHGDLQTPVIEFADAAAAREYAASIDAYGCQVCIVNGKFLAMAGADNGVIEDQAEYDLLANLIHGRPLA